MLESYLTFVKTNSIDVHVGILGFVFTVCGFGLTLWKIYKLGQNSRELATQIEHTRKTIAAIDTVRDLSSAMELLKGVREKLVSNRVTDVPGHLMNLRLALIRIRETHPDADINFNTSIQTLVTEIQMLEASMLGGMMSNSDYSARKIQRDLKTLAGCLNELQSFLVRTQILAASKK